MNTETLLAKQANDIALTRLLLQMETIEEMGTSAHVEQYDVMSQALSYLADPQQLEEMSTRDIPQRWMEIVASA